MIVNPREALLAFGAGAPKTSAPIRNLSVAAISLKRQRISSPWLRQLDNTGVDAIAVMPIPKRGLGEAINDRLQARRRASDEIMTTLDPNFAQRLKDAVGSKGWSEDANDIVPHLTELRGRWLGQTPLLLKPSSTPEVARILALIATTRARRSFLKAATPDSSAGKSPTHARCCSRSNA